MGVRDEWILAGLEALRAGGIDAVRIDRLAAQLGKTKGSFHHHFAGAAAYHQALLDRFADDAEREVRALTEATAGAPVADALGRVALSMQFDPALESAIRGWAGTSGAARDALARVDGARLNALTDVWHREIADRDRARIAALVPHLVVVGASATQPTPSGPEIAGVFALLAALIPHVPDALAEAG